MLGDVLSYICVLFPVSYLGSLYTILVYVRLFLAGISFLIYCRNTKISPSSSLVGSIIYIFSSYSLYSAINNPYILNMMILVPFLLIGIEQLIVNNKKVLFILFVSISLITNIYFLPFILLLVLFYSTILIFNKYFIYGMKIILNAYLRVIFSLIISFLISSIVLVPFIFNSYNYILNLNNYFNLSLLGLNGIFLIYLPLALKKIKENKNYIILFLLFGFVFLINSLGEGFRFYNNTSFVLCFLSSLLISKTIDLYSNISRVDFKWIISFFTVILLIIFVLNIEISRVFLFTLITGFVFLILLLNKRDFKKKILYSILFYILLISSIGFSIFNNYKVKEELLYRNKDISKEIINSIADDSFYRVMFDDSKMINTNDFNYMNNLYYDFASDLNVLSLKDFNNRTRLLSLMGEKYYITNNNDLYVPKKHKLLFEKNGYSVFENRYYIGFAAFYDSYVPSNIYDEFNSLEKESSLFRSVVLDDDDINNDYLKQNNLIRDDLGKEVIKVNFDVKEEDNKIFISMDEVNIEGELYLEITNLKSSGGNISFEFRNRLYNKEVLNNEDLLVNFTSFNRFDEDIVIDLSLLDSYSYDDIYVYIVKFDDYISDVENLKSSNFEVIEFNNSYVRGRVDSAKSGFLQFATAYSRNWDILVDGKSVDTYLSNKYFLGIYLDEGVHEIELVYNFEYLTLTYILFIIGITLFCGILVLEVRKNGVKNEKRKKRS